MDWGERYFACTNTERAIWAETRGFGSDYQGKWKRDLFRAIPSSVTTREVADALRRYEKWTTRMPKSEP